MEKKTFVMYGISGFVAPRHVKAIQDNGGILIGATDPHDSCGFIDSYYPDCEFFTSESEFRLFCKDNEIDYTVICTPNYLHKSQAEFAITTIGYENKLNQINLNVFESEAQAAIYGMSAGLARDMANYYSQTNDIQMRELLFKRSTYEQDILKTRNAGLLDLEYRSNMFNFATTESNMRMDALREDTNRSREEANWLATQHLLAGNKGYSLNIQMGNAAATASMWSGLAGAANALSQINWGG